MKVITYNIRSFSGSGNVPAEQLACMPENLAQGLHAYDPDILCIQEAQYEEKVKRLADNLEMTYAYFPGGVPTKGWPEGISGAVLSRFPIVESTPFISDGERVFTRFGGLCKIDSPAGELHVYGAHLHHIESAFRVEEAKIIVAEILEQQAPQISGLVLGDLNMLPDTPEYRIFAQAGLIDTFGAYGSGPGLSWPSQAPNQRIDYIWTQGPIAETHTCSRLLTQAPYSWNEEDPSSWALSDHLPLILSSATV